MSTGETKFYVIENQYSGPDADQSVDVDTIEICTEPARLNRSGNTEISGYCGTTNDWSVYAHGVYGSIEAAREAITEDFGQCREADLQGYEFAARCGYAVEVYKPGRYTPLDLGQSYDWCEQSIYDDINASTTDDEIMSLFDRYEIDANEDGLTLSPQLDQALTDYRREQAEIELSRNESEN